MLKLHPWLFAKLLHPIFMKSILRVQEPFPWKGGMLADIWKGTNAGPREECAASRGVEVSDIAAKQLNSWFRSHLLGPYHSFMRDGQCAGAKGRGTDVCGH